MKAAPMLAVFAIGGAQPVIAADANTIPLCAGLTIVTAISQPEGDYESIKTIVSVDGNGIQLKYSAEHPVTDFPGAPPRLEKLNLSRLIRAEDLQNSKLYLQQYQTNLPNAIPGTTALGTSAAVLSALKNQGKAELGMFDLPPPLPGAKKLSSDRALHPGVLDYSDTYALQRVDQPPAMIPMTVNGVKTELPSVHATGRSQDYGYKAEFFFLDDPANPLALQWRLRIGSVLSGPKAGMDRDRLQVVKITHHCSPTPGQMTPLERALTDQRRAEVFDVYFSFNSAELREESEPTLREIAELMRKRADWRLSIEGHTDNIAGDAFNLELSKRRAAAVKNALVTRYGISTSRLMTNGHGRSQPVDTNDTEEGRARNRRVELIRQG
jgi:outer membrane protein OmpA-like peptidoglycan-associated protein